MYYGSSQASLVVNTVKNLLAMWETQVQSLGQEDLLDKGMLPYSCLENSMDRGAWQDTVHGVTQNRTLRATLLSFIYCLLLVYSYAPTHFFIR